MGLIKVAERGGNAGKMKRGVDEEEAAGECNRRDINRKTNED